LLQGHRRRLQTPSDSRPPPSSVSVPPARAFDDPLDVHVHAVHVIVGRGREGPADGFPEVVAGYGAVQPVVALHRTPAQELHLDRGAELGGTNDTITSVAVTSTTTTRRWARAATPLRVKCLPAPAVAELQPDRCRRLDRRLALVSLLRNQTGKTGI